MIELKGLNRAEAIRYMGGAGIKLTAKMEKLMDDCEAELIRAASPRYLYKIIDLPKTELMVGNDIKNHLEGCEKAVMMCATLGAGVDRLLRISQIADMAKAVVLDSFACVAIEQVCSAVDELVAQENPNAYMTFRFSPGYGDYPLTLQRLFLAELDASKKIGLSVNESYLLIPSKSVTAIAGISSAPIERKKRGCAVCNLRASCKFRKSGEHCGY